MSRLKFRAWDISQKEFLYPEKPTSHHWILDLNGRFLNLQDGSGGDEYVVQQFTGLRDKNGKDIYEGDILKYEIKPPSLVAECYRSYTAQVYWHDLRIGFEVVGLDHMFVHLGIIPTKGQTVEVIGNILETPEFLQQNNE